MKNNYEEAIENFKKSIKINPQRSECHYNLGNAYCSKDEFEKALESYIKAIEINPKYDVAFFNLGNILLLKNQFDKAMKYLEESVKISNNDEWHNYIGKLYLEKNDEENARRHFNKVLEKNPNELEAQESIKKLNQKFQN